MSKVPEFGRPHQDEVSFGLPVESAVADLATILPIITYDEGLGVINSYKSNPQNTSFATYAGANCYPTSRVDNVFAQLQVNMSKIMLETDKVHAIKFATMKIYTSFMDGQLAEDEVSGLDLNEILELQNEPTDRQTMPLYNGVDLDVYKAGGLNLGADQDGLTTDLKIEAVAFQEETYYNCLQYLTNGEKLKKMQSGLQWHTLTRQHPTKTLRFTQNDKTKYMNPYTFLGVLVYVPPNGLYSQIGKIGDTTVDTSTIEFTWKYRYIEKNHEFNHSLQ